MSIAQFWHRAAEHDRITAERVAVIGGGETAASILNELFRHRVSTITVISPQVTLFTRGESFFENTLFSDPTGWNALTLAERRDALNRTDRGVFSARVQDLPLFTQDVLDLLELGLGGPLTGDALQESIGPRLGRGRGVPEVVPAGPVGPYPGAWFPQPEQPRPAVGPGAGRRPDRGLAIGAINEEIR
jgi:hypothetical protein